MAKIELEGYINQSSLRKRGWEQGRIDYILGNPDALMDNPYHPESYKVKLYKLERVKAFEDDSKRLMESYHAVRNQTIPKLIDTSLKPMDFRPAAT